MNIKDIFKSSSDFKKFVKGLEDKLLGSNNLRSKLLKISFNDIDFFDIVSLYEKSGHKFNIEEFIKNKELRIYRKIDIELEAKDLDEYNEKYNFFYKKFNKIKKDTDDYRKNTGINPLSLGYGFIYKKLKDNFTSGNKFLLSPIFLIPLDLKIEKNSITIKIEGDIKFNKYFINYLSVKDNFNIVDFESETSGLIDNIETYSDMKKLLSVLFKYLSIDKKDYKISKLLKSTINNDSWSYLYFESGKITHFLGFNPSILNDIKFLKNKADLYYDILLNIGDIDISHTFSNTDFDPSQYSILKSIDKGDNLIIHGPPGTGKSTVLVGIIKNLLSDNKKILVVSHKQVALEVIKEKLDNEGYNDLSIIIDGDIKKSRIKLVKEIRDFYENSIVEKYNVYIYDFIEYINDFTKQEVKYNKLVAKIKKSKPELLHSSFSELIGKYYLLHRKLLSNGLNNEKIQTLFNELYNSGFFKGFEFKRKKVDEITTFLDEFYDFADSADIELLNMLNIGVYGLDNSDVYKNILSFIEKHLNKISLYRDQVNKNIKAVFFNVEKVNNLDFLDYKKYLDVFYSILSLYDRMFSIKLYNLSGIKGDIKGFLNKNISSLEYHYTNYRKYISVGIIKELGNNNFLYLDKIEFLDNLNKAIVKIDKIISNYSSKKIWFLERCPICSNEYKQLKKEVVDILISYKDIIFYNEDTIINNKTLLSKEKYVILLNNLKQIYNTYVSTLFLDEINPYFLFETNNVDFEKIKSDISLLNDDIFSIFKLFELNITFKGDKLDVFLLELLFIYEKLFRGYIEKQDRLNIGLYDINDKLIKELNRLLNDDYIINELREKINNLNTLGLEIFLEKNILSKHKVWSSLFKILLYKFLLKQKDIINIPTNTNLNKLFTKLNKNYDKIKSLIKEKIFEVYYRNNIIFDKPYIKRNFLIKSSSKNKAKTLREYFIHGYNDVILSKFPVFLSTPESCSSIIPMDKGKVFDVIIFDEASQVKIEEVFPLLFRADKVIVSGDEKQMPPPRYFSTNDNDIEDQIEGEDEEWKKVYGESLLDLAVKVGFSETYLNYHYRSLYRYLIEFSNHAFYNGRLNILSQDYSKCIDYINCNGIYENQSNEEEVKKIIDKLLDLGQLDNVPSILVATFNQKQRDKILEKILTLKEIDAKKSAIFTKLEEKGLLIRNLESIQGDEKDIVIISTTFGPDGNGKYRENLGLMTKQYSGNYLNVLITRAKKHIYLYSSVPFDKINSFEERFYGNDNKKWFYAYLFYANAVSEMNKDKINKVLKVLDINYKKTEILEGKNFDSAFEEEVYDSLLELGLSENDIITQKWIGNYRVDIFINSNNYNGIIIECDGATYHSSEEAFYYDRYRQKQLEEEGYKFIRVWSTEWFKNKNHTLSYLKNELKKLGIKI